MPIPRLDAPAGDDAPPAAPDEHLEAAIFPALADPTQPRLVFQPIVDLRTGDVVGYETLSRFVSPLSASPDRWFAAAGRLGVGVRLQADVIQRGIDRLPTLPDDTFLTVNLDPRLLTAPEIAELLTTSGSLDRLVIEFTEQTVARDVRRMLALLDRARELGAMVAMGEAGAGYTSLQNLRTVRPELVKLGRSLVTDLDSDAVRRTLVSMLCELVGRLDARMIAEGLEGFGELRACIDLGVPMGQGWLLGRPTDEWRLTAPTAVVDQICGRMLLRDTADVLAPLVATVPVAGSRAEAVEMFVTHPAVEHVALVDDHMRPTALLGRTIVARGDASGPPLVAQTS